MPQMHKSIHNEQCPHVGMWSQIYGKPNTLKGLAVLVLDGEVCDE